MMSPHFVGMATKKSWIMGEKFESKMPHHNGIKELWETKWKFPVSAKTLLAFGTYTKQCTKSVYPFHDGKNEDFAPVFEHLIKVSYRRAPNFNIPLLTPRRMELTTV